jgi:hypothetical protein
MEGVMDLSYATKRLTTSVMSVDPIVFGRGAMSISGIRVMRVRMG